MFRLNESEVYTSTDLTATIDNTDYVDVLKKFAVKYDQTLAHSIASNDIPDLIEKDLNKYIRYYESIGGVVREKKMGEYNKRPGGEVIMAYLTDEKNWSARAYGFLIPIPPVSNKFTLA